MIIEDIVRREMKEIDFQVEFLIKGPYQGIYMQYRLVGAWDVVRRCDRFSSRVRTLE